MFHNRRPFVFIHEVSGEFYADLHRAGIPLDIHEDPDPPFWRRTRLFTEISPRRMGIKEVFYIRKNAAAAARFTNDPIFRSAVEMYSGADTYDRQNPFFFIEKIPQTAGVATETR
jgi:hypothetical protein